MWTIGWLVGSVDYLEDEEMTRLGLTGATTMRGRRIRKEHAESRGKRGFACYML